MDGNDLDKDVAHYKYFKERVIDSGMLNGSDYELEVSIFKLDIMKHSKDVDVLEFEVSVIYRCMSMVVYAKRHCYNEYAFLVDFSETVTDTLKMGYEISDNVEICKACIDKIIYRRQGRLKYKYGVDKNFLKED